MLKYRNGTAQFSRLRFEFESSCSATKQFTRVADFKELEQRTDSNHSLLAVHAREMALHEGS